ncbi:hypothetical protein E2C01_077372 [Portunus trituberculatus]|uniref:Uncharacterized protein n=1 Tax=Portunus trituberculatus TaxID=210409 RepID=A0A5B7IFW9_PORTR|nr:hypothetical protein [Portunus trituberculatus]
MILVPLGGKMSLMKPA